MRDIDVKEITVTVSRLFQEACHREVREWVLKSSQRTRNVREGRNG